MPRRRSGMTDRASSAPLVGSIGFMLLASVFTHSGCQPSPDDNGCSVTRQLVIPGTTPLALLTDVRIDRAGDGLVVFGNDGAAVRWVVVDGQGTVGAEQ